MFTFYEKGKKEVSEAEIKQIQLNILIEIDAFCRENRLKYFIGYGTLLGAIRHKGFIPWDDDIDIWMPRPDYDRFIKIFVSANYQLNAPEKNGYWLSLIKVSDKRTYIEQNPPMSSYPIGVHIDIMPLDGEPNDMNIFVQMMDDFIRLRQITIFYREILHGHSMRTFFSRNLIHFLYNSKKYMVWSLKKTLSLIENKAHDYRYENSDYVGWITACPYLYKERVPRKIFEETIEVEFEGHMFYAPKRYDELLKHYYGNYMSYPPVEKRVSVHIWSAFWLN